MDALLDNAIPWPVVTPTPVRLIFKIAPIWLVKIEEDDCDNQVPRMPTTLPISIIPEFEKFVFVNNNNPVEDLLICIKPLV